MLAWKQTLPGPFFHHLCSHLVKINLHSYYTSTCVLAWNSSVKMKVVMSLLVLWLTSTLCVDSFLMLSFFSCFPRATLWLPHEGMAVFLHLHRAFVCAPFFHFPVADRGGRSPGEDLAEGDLSKENLLRVQGELRQQHEFLACSEALVQKADEGAVNMHLLLCICRCL